MNVDNSVARVCLPGRRSPANPHRALRPFSLFEPGSVAEAVEILRSSSAAATVLAGGLDLVRSLSRWETSPELLVSLRRIPGLDVLEVVPGPGSGSGAGAGYSGVGDRAGDLAGDLQAPAGSLRLGALVTIRDIEQSPAVRTGWPLLYQAAAQIASVQVKTMGTVVGNLCSASPASDLAVALAALDARVEIAGAQGTRVLELPAFFQDACLTALVPGEIVTHVLVPPLPAGARGAFRKLATTKASIAKVNAAAVVAVRHGCITHARLALGAVAPTVLRVEDAEAFLLGAEATPEALVQAAELAESEVAPIDDLRAGAGYRRVTAGVLAKRVLSEAVETTAVSEVSAVSPVASSASPAVATERPGRGPVESEAASFQVNGQRHTVLVHANTTLLEVLRDHLGLTGTKRGCSCSGNCGACTVLLDGRPVLSCLTLAWTVRDRHIVTIEGLAGGRGLHPLQDAFLEHGAVQCGFCTPGMVLSAKALLDENPDPGEEEVRRGLAGNLCRCTGYVKIVEAVLAAATTLRSEDHE